MIERELSLYPEGFRQTRVPASVMKEARNRILDTLGCFYGAFDAKPARSMRKAFLPGVRGGSVLWGTGTKVPFQLGAWLNGTCVRTLDYNDTYLSKEPCHPSDLLSSLWAACEISGSSRQGTVLLRAVVLGYDVLCRLCDAKSLRKRGWDHVTYLPIASAIACSYILGLDREQTGHAVALSMTGNNALRQTRVGSISDWKASCASYAASAGLWAAVLARTGYQGPDKIFSGRNGFFRQVSGSFSLSKRPFDSPWRILDTHVKYFPAEHHAQSAVEAAVFLHPQIKGMNVRAVVVAGFDAAVDIIGKEREKWTPQTRETADHSLPYLVSIALLEGNVTLRQYEKKRFLDPDVRNLMKKTRVSRESRLNNMYPKFLPMRLTVKLANGRVLSQEVLRPRGYAGRPMSDGEMEEKFARLASRQIPARKIRQLIGMIRQMESVKKLSQISNLMVI